MSLDLEKLKAATAAVKTVCNAVCALPGPLVGGQSCVAGTLTAMGRELQKTIEVWDGRALTPGERGVAARGAISVRLMRDDKWVIDAFKGAAVPLPGTNDLVSIEEALSHLHDQLLAAGQ